MRVFLEKKVRNLYFQQLKDISKLPWLEISKRLDISDRHLRECRVGKYSLSSNVCEKIEKVYRIPLPKTAIFKKDYWNNANSARKAGIKRFKLYGNFGTPEGRRKGGLNSLKTHKLLNTDFQLLEKIHKPKKSNELAELVGIMLGDGNISKYQVKVFLNLIDDIEYAEYVSKLFNFLFKVNSSIYKFPKHTTAEVVVSRKKLVKFLNSLGLPIGNKIRQKINIPSWIKDNPDFRKWCIRGLFDTDGCVYADRHSIDNKNYSSLNLAITSASTNLLLGVSNILKEEGFSPTFSGISVRLRKSEQVVRFFDKIGSSNPKNLKRFVQFQKERCTEW